MKNSIPGGELTTMPTSLTSQTFDARNQIAKGEQDFKFKKFKNQELSGEMKAYQDINDFKKKMQPYL